MRPAYLEEIRKNVDEVNSPDVTVDRLKEISCAFYRRGKNPYCKGCLQEEDKVRECSTIYASKILDRPLLQWAKEFDLILAPAEKIKVDLIPGIGMLCDDCYIKGRCPRFKPATACSIDFGEGTEMKNAKEVFDVLISLQLRRIKRAEKFEELDGGVPDQNLNVQMDMLIKLLEGKDSMGAVKMSRTDSIHIPVNDANGLPQQDNILARMFSSKSKQIEAPPAGEQIPYADVVIPVAEKTKNADS